MRVLLWGSLAWVLTIWFKTWNGLSKDANYMLFPFSFPSPCPWQLRITVWSLCTKSVSYIKYPKACQQGESARGAQKPFLCRSLGFGDLFSLENFKHRQEPPQPCVSS